MAKEKAILVCGFGRCGSSLMMQMLDAGGIKCLGEGPAYEPAEVGMNRNMKRLLFKLGARAAKILDPQRSKWPKIDGVKIIWMHRNPHEQAKSQVKFLTMLSGYQMGSMKPHTIAKLTDSFVQDLQPTMGMLKSLGADILEMHFEEVLESPLYAAQKVDAFVGHKFDTEKAASVVIKRSHECAPGLDIEMQLVKKAEA